MITTDYAVSAVKQSSNYGRGARHAIYLALCEGGQEIPMRLTTARSWMRWTIYKSATKQTRELREFARRLAEQVRDGQLTWTEAIKKFSRQGSGWAACSKDLAEILENRDEGVMLNDQKAA